MDIPFPQGSVYYLSAAVSESGSGHSFLDTSFVNHPSPNKNTVCCILALFVLIPRKSLQARSSFPHGSVSSI
ncbi:hypothetical protein BDR06DRAFT_952678 [Suillus hirtellus]|nr:hypothetical protein BDR06DRAFT_952678 [Suillus hirtellus]